MRYIVRLGQSWLSTQWESLFQVYLVEGFSFNNKWSGIVVPVAHFFKISPPQWIYFSKCILQKILGKRNCHHEASQFLSKINWILFYFEHNLLIKMNWPVTINKLNFALGNKGLSVWILGNLSNVFDLSINVRWISSIVSQVKGSLQISFDNF